MSKEGFEAFSIEVPIGDPKGMEALQEFMDDHHKEMDKYIANLAQELGISEVVASDITYLRGRSRWTPELEDRIIKCAKEKGVKDFNACTGGEEEILRENGY